MLCSILHSFRGESPGDISRGDSDLKSIKVINALIHVLRTVLILLGVTLLVLGGTGLIGLPGLISGALILTLGSVLLIPFLIKYCKKISMIDYSLFKKTEKEAEAFVKKVEAYASENPKLLKKWKSVHSNLKAVISHCDAKSLYEIFYIPLLMCLISLEPDLVPEGEEANILHFKSLYLIVMSGLKNFQKLEDAVRRDTMTKHPEDMKNFGAKFSFKTILLTLNEKNSGLQVIRGGLRLLYSQYLELRSSVSDDIFIDINRQYYGLMLLYNDVLKNCRRIFSLEEIRKITELKEQMSSESNKKYNVRNGDFLYQMLTCPDKQMHFSRLNLVDPNLGRDGGYDFLWV